MALLATTLLATPAMARDKTLYIGAEAGITWGTDTDIDAENIDDDDITELDNFVEIDHKMGYDVGLIFGYDAGIVRAELDLSYKHVGIDEVRQRLRAPRAHSRHQWRRLRRALPPQAPQTVVIGFAVHVVPNLHDPAY